MAFRCPTALVLLSLAVLSACGGGGGSGIASAPVPVSPPTPAPTPTPAPSPTPASTFQSVSFGSIGVDAQLENQPDGTSRVSEISRIQAAKVEASGNLEIRGPNSYAVELYGVGGPEFLPASYKGSDGTFDRWRATDKDGNIANLDIASNGAGIALTYTTFGNYAYSWGPSDNVEITYFAAGSTTPSAQVPRTGTATYTGIADGLWIDGPTVRRLYGSTASLTANFATGQVTSLLDLRGYGDPFGDFLRTGTTVLGTFTGTGTIGGSYYDGTYAPNHGYSGLFIGQFFGPGANETGWGFRLTGADGQLVTGAAAGKR